MKGARIRTRFFDDSFYMKQEKEKKVIATVLYAVTVHYFVTYKHFYVYIHCPHPRRVPY